MKQRYTRRKLIRLIAFAVIFATVLVFAELAARNWWLANRPSRYVVFAEHTPPPYVNAPYFSLAFLSEQSQAVRSLHTGPDGELTSEFHGQWYNFDDGFRRTTGQPPNAQHTIYMFGNSSMLSFEVPDEDTIPSQVQALYNARMGGNYRVVNVGHSAYSAILELALLKKLPLKPGDVAIFYDGIIDAEIGGGGDPGPESLPVQACGWISDKMPNLSLGKIYCLFTPSRGPSTDPAVWATNAQNVADTYERNLLAAQRYAASKQVQFYHFLEPTITSKPLSSYEQAMVDNPLLVVGDMRFIWAYTTHNWSTLQTVNLKLWQAGMNTTDLTHLLDPIRSQGQEVYIDFYHVNEVGNQIIARAIFDAITQI